MNRRRRGRQPDVRRRGRDRRRPALAATAVEAPAIGRNGTGTGTVRTGGGPVVGKYGRGRTGATVTVVRRRRQIVSVLRSVRLFV